MMYTNPPLNQLKNEDFLSPLLTDCADIKVVDEKYESQQNFVNDLVTTGTEEVVFNSFFSFIEDPEKDDGSEENFEKDIKTKYKVEDGTKAKGKKRKKYQASREYFEEDLKPKKEDDTEVKDKKRNNDKLFDCEDCDFSTNYPSHLRHHEQSVHNGVVRYFCPLCEYKSFFRNTVDYHIGSKHRGQNARIMLLECYLCQRGEAHEECLKSESRKATKRFKCETCEFKSNSRQSLKNHVSAIHEKIHRYSCSLCDKKSYFKHHIKSHQFSHGKEPCRVLTIGCIKCERKEDHPRCYNKQKAKKPNIDQPKKRSRKNPSKTGKYKCGDCDYSHDRRGFVKRHTDSVHKGIVKFFCKECSYKTFHRSAMILHMKSHGGSSNQPLRIGCEQCELNIAHKCVTKRTGSSLEKKKLSTQKVNTLKEKVLKPKDTKEVRCDDCQISFADIWKLNRHKLSRRHQGIVRYRCSVCNFKHFFSIHVKVHQETSHADKICKVFRIGCEECDNDISNHSCVRFRSKKLNQRPELNCDVCPFITYLRRSLFNHVQSVHLNQVRYYCDSCQYKSYYKKHVEIHLRQTHESHSKQGADRRVKTIGCDDCADNVEHQCGKQMKPTKFNCEKCKYSTRSKNNLKIHIEAKHEYLVRFACSSCDKKAYFKQTLEKHLIKGHKNGEAKVREIQCPGCQTKVDHENCLRKLEFKLHCKLCKYSTNAEANLSNHVKKDHLNILRFSCGNCPLKTFYRHHLVLHQARAHRGEECEIIKIEQGQTDKIVGIQDQKVKRRRWKPPSTEEGSLNQFQCDKCEFSTQNKMSLYIHKKNIHEKVKNYACSECDYKSYLRLNVKSHLRKHKEEQKPGRVIKVGCPLCVSDVPRSCAKLKLNQTRPSTGPSIECSLCPSRPSFNSNKLRLAHHKEVHPGQHIFTCSHCDYGTNYLPNLNTHSRSRHEKRRLQCDKCDYWTTWNTSFHQHQREKHGLFKKKSKHYTDGQQYLCDQCAFSTFSKVEFEKHKDHSGSTGFVRRPKTHRRTLNTLAVKIEPSVHQVKSKVSRFIVPLVPKAFRCEACEYSTDLVSNLKAHVKQVHEGVKYQCDQCDYKATRHNLKIHVDNIHLGLRFKCESCEHVSTTRANLKIHNKTKHGGVRIQCNKCDFATFYISNLRTHLNTVHQK